MIVAPAISGAMVSSRLERPEFGGFGRLASLQKSGVLRVGVAADLPGFGWVDENGFRSGLDVKVAQMLSQCIFGGDLTEASEHVEFVDCAVKDRERKLNENDVDMVVAAYAVTKERRRHVDFAGVYYGSHVGFARRADFDGPMNRCHFGVVEGTVAEAFLRENYRECEITAFEDAEAGISALMDGSLHYFAEARSCLTPLGETHGEELRICEQVGPFAPWAIGLNKGDAELACFVEARMADIVDSGVLMLLSPTVGSKPWGACS